MLARLQQITTFALFLGAACWCAYWFGSHPWLAVFGALGLVFIHAPVLGAEFLLLAWINRADLTPPASAGQLLSAWWGEVWTTPAIFWWRQPFRPNAEPDLLPAQAQGRRGAVLIHGFVCNRGFWTPWLRRLRAAGHPFVAVNLEPVFGEISDYVTLIDAAVRQVQAATGLPPVLICHSMGGLAARAWLAQAGDDARVAHVVTIGSPHQGTWLGRFSRSPNARQMVPGCDWLCQLGAGESASRRSRFTCWYSNCDNIVFPASTATLAGADNRFLSGPAHVHMAFDEQVIVHALGLLASK